MRLPKIRQLTEEQKRVYLYAPTDRHVLVNGPPGTGKTLIACLRAVELQKKKVPVVLGVFNRVLAKYSSNAADGGALPSQTVITWFREWWKNSGLPPHRGHPGRISIEADITQKELIKAAGARWYPQEWRPWQSLKGVWMVDADRYFFRPEDFANWRLWHDLPVLDGRDGGIDWLEIAKHIIQNDECIQDAALSLGTLLIDEGQDFPPGFYKTLRQICALAAARGSKVAYPPRCFILADENQQITEDNSTLQEIADALKIVDENRYLLLDNFRNSKEIAELARAFFADVGALPRVPVWSSEKPAYIRVHDLSGVVSRIRIWVANNPGKETGVFVFNDSTRATMVTELEHALGGMRGRNVTIQTYSWETRKINKADSLLFDTPDVVTVLNMQSCKGLEFDAVFVVDLHRAQIGIYGPDRFKMQMFVAVSRGRERVSLIDSGPHAGAGPYFDCLPASEFLERESDLATGSIENTPAAPAPPKRQEHAPAPAARVHATGRPGADNWETALAKLAERSGFRIADRRAAGGAIWVNGGSELHSALEPLGFAYSEKRAGWWRK